MSVAADSSPDSRTFGDSQEAVAPEASTASYAELLGMIANVVKEPSLTPSTSVNAQSSLPTLVNLPSFVAPPAASMSPPAFAFLNAAGCFELPSTSVQKMLITAYFEFVQPPLPLTDFWQYEDILELSHVRRNRISLLLYTALLFAGAIYVDQTQLSHAGHPVRWVLMQDLFEKAKV